jgi:hypothetical protein
MENELITEEDEMLLTGFGAEISKDIKPFDFYDENKDEKN